jgi:hypothetical protein
MRRITIWAATFVFVVAAAAIFLCAPSQRAQAQPGSLSFHGLIEDQLLVSDLLLRPGDDWGGYIQGYLGDEFLQGKLSGNDGTVTGHRWVGMGKDGTMYFDFGNGNTFTTTATQGTFPNPPGQFPAGGMYQGAHKITAGTGRFAYASGNLFIRGPYLVWDLDKPLPQGRFNAEITGNISGVQ